MKTNNKRHNDVSKSPFVKTVKEASLLSKEVNTVVKYNKADMMKFIFKPMNTSTFFRQKCVDIAHNPVIGANVHKLAPLIETISEVLSDPYFEYSPEDCGDHHIQSAIDCLQVASRHLIKNATDNKQELI
jgi:hypothetical protein